MSDMKCPVCNEGKIIANLDGTYECDNPECPIWNGTETATFETLIRTRKVLMDTIKLAEEMLESIEDEGLCSEYYEDELNKIKNTTKYGDND